MMKNRHPTEATKACGMGWRIAFWVAVGLAAISCRPSAQSVFSVSLQFIDQKTGTPLSELKCDWSEGRRSLLSPLLPGRENDGIVTSSVTDANGRISLTNLHLWKRVAVVLQHPDPDCFVGADLDETDDHQAKVVYVVFNRRTRSVTMTTNVQSGGDFVLSVSK